MRFPRSPLVRSLLLATAVVIAASCSPLPGSTAGAQPVTAPFRPYTAPRVSLEASAVAVPSTGSFSYTAVVHLSEPASYLQARLRIRRPSGRLLYQKTFVRSAVTPGVRTFRYSRGLGDFDLAPGSYGVELSVDTEGTANRSWEVTDTLRVYDPSAPALPLALFVKVLSAPTIDPQGRFVTDPALETRVRDEIVSLSNAVLATPTLKLSLAVAPQVFAEWQMIAKGYEIAGPAGVTEVAADDATPRAYAGATERLRAALSTGRIELVSVPCADPDIAGISSVGRIDDLARQLERGTSTCFAALEQTPSACAFTARGVLTASGARVARDAGMRSAFVAPRFARSSGATAAPGAYISPRLPLTVLVQDADLAPAIAAGDTRAVTDALFSRAAAADGSTTCVPALFETGPGRTATIGTLLNGIDEVRGQPWLSFETAREAASLATTSADLTLVSRASIGKYTPPGWWEMVADARTHADALASALSAESRDAQDALSGSFIAECAYWSGPDGRWALADRARSFASAAERRASDLFSKVELVTQDITFSGAKGSVPLSITNNSEQRLTLTLRVTTSGVRMLGKRDRAVQLLPAENYLTIPVDLRSSLGGTLRVELLAGAMTIASRTIGVKASYIDKLAILAGIAVLMGGILLFIRRRIRASEMPTRKNRSSEDRV